MVTLRHFTLGYTDYGLVVHISDILQGSVYGFGTQGHQVIYEELDVYSLAVSFFLSPSTFWENKTSKKNEGAWFNAPTKSNPYHLPWIMAKLTSDAGIASNPVLSMDLDNLIGLFEEWEPASSGNKALKDVKFRLEPLRGKL